MRTAPVKTKSSFEEYLEFEAQSQVRHEFVDGNLFVMAGGTARHAFLKDEFYALSRVATRKCGCFAFTSDASLQTPSGNGYYPDVLITCENFTGNARVFYAPSILVEVLSDSTEHIDRGEKWRNYQAIPSLEQYILLSQSEPNAEIFSRNTDGSWRYELYSGKQSLVLPRIKWTLSLEELYRDLLG
jgi:Uma2 family endonuclease